MGLRIGIDVGGTFTHGVALEPPGKVICSARTPTTHTDERGVAAGIAEVLRQLLAELERLAAAGVIACGASAVELVAHSTTQATNALLEGDLAGVHLLAIVPPGERGLVSRALRQRHLEIGGGHRIRLWPKLMEDWRRATSEHYPNTVGVAPARPEMKIEALASLAGRAGATPTVLSSLKEPSAGRPGWEGFGIPDGFWVSERLPVAVVQPLAGKHELREQNVAVHYRACGHPTVAASDITQVLGLQARARTAVVNAAMLPTMLTTAEYTEKVVNELLPGVPLQVVRSDGGAMTIAEMRKQPILSLLSGPAAGASAALHRSGLSDAVFIEVGGTSTDITLIKEGRVRHRYATVGGQRLMVPALDLRTVAVGGGSMLRADKPLFGPRSAHIAGMPYLFQALASGRSFLDFEGAPGRLKNELYVRVPLDDDTYAAFTLTDYWLTRLPDDQLGAALRDIGVEPSGHVHQEIRRLRYDDQVGPEWQSFRPAFQATIQLVSEAVVGLAADHGAGHGHTTLVAGGGGGPVIQQSVSDKLALESRLIPDHAVISAIGAALAVTCVSISRHCAQPSGGDIAELIDEVERRLAAQGAERVATDYEYDPRRQVLTVTGRGSRPYEQDTEVRSEDALRDIAQDVLKADPDLTWHDDGTWLWTTNSPSSRKRPSASLACSTDRFGRVLWLGKLAALEVAPAGRIADALERVTARHTQHTDGGAVLPHLGLLTGGRYIPLDQLGSAELIVEVLRWEKLPADAQGCFVVGR